MLLAAGGDPPPLGRQEVAVLLGQILRDEGDNLYSLPQEDLQALGTLYQLADQRAQPEANVILSTMLGTKTGFVFRVFAAAAGISPERQRTLTLAAAIRLPDEGTLQKRLHTILGRTTLRVWIDDAVSASKDKPDMGVLEGPRLEVLEKLLAQAKLHLEILESNLFWIGPLDKLGAARQVHAGSLQRAAAAQGKPAAALMDETRLEFIETPLQDVVCFLRDQHDISFEELDQSDKPITLTLRAVPLHLCSHTWRG